MWGQKPPKPQNRGANASLYNLTKNRNVRVSMWLLVRIIWSNVVLNLCKFCFRTNEHLVNRDKLTIGQMMGPNIKSNKNKLQKA